MLLMEISGAGVLSAPQNGTDRYKDMVLLNGLEEGLFVRSGTYTNKCDVPGYDAYVSAFTAALAVDTLCGSTHVLYFNGTDLMLDTIFLNVSASLNGVNRTANVLQMITPAVVDRIHVDGRARLWFEGPVADGVQYRLYVTSDSRLVFQNLSSMGASNPVIVSPATTEDFVPTLFDSPVSFLPSKLYDVNTSYAVFEVLLGLNYSRQYYYAFAEDSVYPFGPPSLTFDAESCWG